MESRPTILSFVPSADAENIAYVSDVEGHWEFFCNFVSLSKGVSFRVGDGRGATTGESLDLDLADGWHFVFGGDSCDKGPGTLRFQEAMVRLKASYPDRVHLLLGNRDVNKMSLTSELDALEVAKFVEVPGERRSNGSWRVSGVEFLKKMAAKDQGLDEDEVTEAMVEQWCTQASKLKYMFKYKMNSDGEFEYRRKELALQRAVAVSEVGDAEVASSYEACLGPGGCTREYLRSAQIGVLIGDALFVHAQIIGNEFKPGKTRFADEQGVAWSIRVVPGREEPVQDIREWLVLLNAWAAEQVNDWQEHPVWRVPFEGKRTRGGARLLDYGTASSAWPTVVYCRWLTKASMPMAYPEDLSKYLKDQDVRYVVVGHTPHGTAPTVIQSGGVTIIMGDTSFSEMNAIEPAFKGDNRGVAACSISFNAGLCGVRGCSETGQIIDYRVAPEGVESDAIDKWVGQIQQVGPEDERFFVKAKLPAAPGKPEDSYVLCNIKGFTYAYTISTQDDMISFLRTCGVDAVITKGISGCGRLGGLDREFLEQVFQELNPDGDGNVSKRELAAKCTESIVRTALMASFPDMNMEQIFRELDMDLDGKISTAVFRDALKSSRVISRHLYQSGIYFEVQGGDTAPFHRLLSGEDANFPCSLGPFKVHPTQQLRPEELNVLWGHGNRLKCPSAYPCDLRPKNRSEALEQITGNLGKDGRLHSHISPIERVNLPPHAKEALSVPQAATYFAWAYPFRSDFRLQHDRNAPALRREPSSPELAMDPDVMFLTVGGYVYFDKDFAVLQMNCVIPDEEGILRFGPARVWRPEWTAKLRRRRRFRPVTLRKLLQAGAMEFCWVRPNELVAGPSEDGAGFTSNEFGAFVYIGGIDVPEGASSWSDAVASFDAFKGGGPSAQAA